MRFPWQLVAICVASLGLRLIFLPGIQHPGIADPNHYYNLALRLNEGHGLTIDYVWHFYNPPAQLVHPDDFWMPLTGVLASVLMPVFGTGVQVALLPFILLSVLLPLLAYAASRHFGVGRGSSLFAAASAGFLPELALYSLRTDSVIPNSLFVGASLLLMSYALMQRRPLVLLVAGVTTGLAYLTRSENLILLPVLFLTTAIHFLRGLRDRRVLFSALAVPLIAFLIALPLLLHNVAVMGSPVTPNLSRMFFMTSFTDHYAYGRELTLDTLLASQTPAQIIGKRLFEMAASAKIMYTTLDIFLPVALFGGALLVLARRDRDRLLIMAPVIIHLAGIYVFYTVLAPFGSQGGSFKKAYVSLIPVLLPFAAYALERVVPEARLRYGTALLATAFLAANAFEAIRADANFVGNYLSRAERVAEVVQTLPDVTGDDQIVLMTQDPYMMRFVGYSSVMFPEEDRETTLAVAERYGVDYMLMPPARASLDALYTGEDVDPRIEEVAAVPNTEYVLYRLNYDAGA